MMMNSDTTAEVSDCVFLSNIVSFRYHFDLILLEEYKNSYFSIQWCVGAELSA